MQTLMDDVKFVKRFVFSDEAAFHMCGKVNKHNVRVWGLENSHVFVEHVRDSSKASLFFCYRLRQSVKAFF